MSKLQSRYFIGLDLSANDKLKIAKWRDSQSFAFTDKPVPVENLHITLSFLGQVKPNKLEQLEDLLDAISAKNVSTQTCELGVFNKAKILYLGINLTESLQHLAQQCLAINGKIGVASPHEIYHPHITLTRKHNNIVPISALPPQLELNFTDFHLFESVSSSQQGKPPYYPKRMSFGLE